MLQNAKNDKAYRYEVDGLIYENDGNDTERGERNKEKRVIENTIVMPMINSKG